VSYTINGHLILLSHASYTIWNVVQWLVERIQVISGHNAVKRSPTYRANDTT